MFGLLAFSSNAAASVCPTGQPQNGVDISSFQGSGVDFSTVAADGISFVYARATDGTTLTDTDYSTFRTGAESAGLAFGAYATFEPAQDPTSQANYFLQAAAPTGSELIPVLDLELPPSGQSTSQFVGEVTTWLNVVQKALGVRPLIYTTPAFWNDNTGSDATFGSDGYPLWVANVASCPTLPSGWSNFLMWQNSVNGSVQGISGPVDTDEFNAGANGGSLSAFTVSGAQLAPPVNHTAPKITGTPAIGAKLSCSRGSWSGFPSQFTYRWLRGGTAIPNATESTYKVASADAGHPLACRVTATNVRGPTSRTSASVQVPAPPKVTSVSPRSGPAAGGNTITIAGSGFVHGASVKFGTAASRAVTFVSATRLKARAPAHAAGKIHVRVTTAAGTSTPTAADEYTYR
jgi:lysozyme